MLKKTLSSFLVMCTSLTIQSTLAFAVGAGNEVDSEYSGPSLEVGRNADLSLSPSESTVTGQVKFEKRYTKATEIQCGRAPCKQAQVYWSIVIQSGETKYLLKEKLNTGNVKAPETVELGGVRLRPGSIVKVDGEVFSGAPNLYIVSNVKNVTLLMDLGWACHNAKESDPSIYARLWFDSRDEAEGSFKIRVQEFSDNAIYQIAFIDRAVFTAHTGELIFGGNSSNVNVELAATHQLNMSQSKYFPAVLKISGQSQLSNQNGMSQISIPLNCSHTRFSSRVIP